MHRESLQIAEITIDVSFRPVKNVHLSVHPPSGHVRMTVPNRTDLDAARAYVVSKLDWIRKQQRELREQERESERTFKDRESHYLWGSRRLLRVTERPGKPEVIVSPRRIHLAIHPGSSPEHRSEVVEKFYRDQVREASGPLFEEWEPRIGVRHQRLYVQRMKTRWGSCTPDSGSIRLNTDLAKKPPICIEYILVHELIHLIEPTHNARFRELMTFHLPDWPYRRSVLNSLPLRHEEWGY